MRNVVLYLPGNIKNNNYYFIIKEKKMKMLTKCSAQILFLSILLIYINCISASETETKVKRLATQRVIKQVKRTLNHNLSPKLSSRTLSTKQPSTSTKSPSSSTCQDNPNIFFEKGDKRTCTWVGRKDTKKRCKNETNARNCPETCGLCSSCEDDTEVWFVNDLRRTCVWVARKDTELRCRDKTNAEHCPETCGLCGNSPVASPVSSPVSSPTEETCQDHDGGYFVNGQRRTCAWVARYNTEFRCSFPVHKEHCPETCGLCSCQDHEGGYFVNGQRRTCAWVARYNTEFRCSFAVHSEHCPETCGFCN